jgi:hypothetical protein
MTTELINKATAARLLGITRQGVNYLVRVGILFVVSEIDGRKFLSRTAVKAYKINRQNQENGLKKKMTISLDKRKRKV